MRPSDVIDSAKRILQDADLLRAPDTYSAATLLDFVNQTLKTTATLRPDLFSYLTDISTVQNTVTQTLPADSARLVEIFAVKDGNAITEVSREVMDQSYPQWRTEPAGIPVNYMRHVRNYNQYFLYPRPVRNIVLIGEYIQIPPNYTLNQTIQLLPDNFFPAIVSGVVALVASIESENARQDRATYFRSQYADILSISLQARAGTDTEEGGLDPKQVI